MNYPAPRRRPPSWTFGSRLRLVRRDMGLKQAEMAKLIGVGAKAYSSWESDQSYPAESLALVRLLQYATGVDANWWIGLSPEGTA